MEQISRYLVKLSGGKWSTAFEFFRMGILGKGCDPQGEECCWDFWRKHQQGLEGVQKGQSVLPLSLI